MIIMFRIRREYVAGFMSVLLTLSCRFLIVLAWNLLEEVKVDAKII